MGLVDREQCKPGPGGDALEGVEEVGDHESLGGDIEQVEIAGEEVASDVGRLCRR